MGMDSSVETSVRGGWKGESDYQLWLYLCMIFAHSLMEISNEDCAVEAGRLVEEIWTHDLFKSQLVCV